MALTWSLPQQLCGAGSLSHKCHVASWVNSWSQKASGIVPRLEGQQWCPAGVPQRTGEHTISPRSALETCYPFLGNEAGGNLLLLWGLLLGNSQFSLTEKKCSRFSSPLIVGGVDDAGLTWDVSIFIILTIVVPICPSGFCVSEYFAIWIISARPCTLCLAHLVPGKMTSIEFMIMQVFYSLQMFYLLQWLLIAALTNSVEAKQPSTTAFFYLCIWNKNQSWQKFEYLDSSWLPHLVKFNNSL